MSYANPYSVLEGYVKHIRRGNTFTTNDIRERLESAGFSSTQVSGAVRKALNSGLIGKNYDSVKSTNPFHNGGNVSVYHRPSSY
jgi:predicted transcriptional regulator